MSSSGTLPFCIVLPNGRAYDEQILAELQRAGFIIRHTLELEVTPERIQALPDALNRKGQLSRMPPGSKFLGISLASVHLEPYMRLFDHRRTEIADGLWLGRLTFWPGSTMERDRAYEQFEEPITRGAE